MGWKDGWLGSDLLREAKLEHIAMQLEIPGISLQNEFGKPGAVITWRLVYCILIREKAAGMGPM
jgi:hypothetical protein